MKAIEIRPASEADFNFLVDLHRQTFRRYVEQNWGWDEAHQRKELHEDFHVFPYHVICDRETRSALSRLLTRATRFFSHTSLFCQSINGGVWAPNLCVNYRLKHWQKGCLSHCMY